MNSQRRNLPLATVATFADGIGVDKALLTGADGSDTGIVAEAHRLGLFVHAWTFRDDSLPPGVADGEAEIRQALSLGIDGFFTDYPDTGARVRDTLTAE